MKKWLSGLKAKLGRLKPWLKQHWKPVLVVAVAAGVFLFIVLKKPGTVAAALTPPASSTGGAAGGDTAATPTTAGSGTTSGATGHGTSGGSLFDPPAPAVSRPALPTTVPVPQTFSHAIQAGALKGVIPQGPSPASHPKIIGGARAGSVSSLWSGAETFAQQVQAAQAQVRLRAQGPSPKSKPKLIVGPRQPTVLPAAPPNKASTHKVVPR